MDQVNTCDPLDVINANVNKVVSTKYGFWYRSPQKHIDDILIKDSLKENEINCPICYEKITNDDYFRPNHCENHGFHYECIVNSLKVTKSCPVCKKEYIGTVGSQPDGIMKIMLSTDIKLDGEEHNGAYVIGYYFNDGIQSLHHPHPGIPYFGTQRRAYLPISDDGKRVLKKLMLAWDKRVLFKIGHSISQNKDNVIIWNISHKTNITGGEQYFGYPDPEYIPYVELELEGVGIV